MATHGDGFRVDRTQEVGGSTGAWARTFEAEHALRAKATPTASSSASQLFRGLTWPVHFPDVKVQGEQTLNTASILRTTTSGGVRSSPDDGRNTAIFASVTTASLIGGPFPTRDRSSSRAAALATPR
jgi:hypothetical protein